MERKDRGHFIFLVTSFLVSLLLSGIPFTLAENIEPIEYHFGMRISNAAYMGFTGKNNQLMGSILSPVPGDFNGDGYNDLLVGDTRDSTHGSYTGKAFIVWGGPHLKERETNLTKSDVDFIGEKQGTDTGAYVSFLGDINDDGIDDIAITAPKFAGDGYRGKIYVFFGKPGKWNSTLSVSDADLIITNDGSDNIVSVLKARDINGDGIDDFVVSVSYKSTKGFTNNGKIYIVFGRASGWKTDLNIYELSDASFEGDSTYQYLGNNMAGGNDLNGDGLYDIVVGANYQSYRGRVYLIFGKESGWERNTSISTIDIKINGHKSYNFGHSMDTGDVNGDGLADLIVGTKHFSGAKEDDDFAYLFLGSRSDWNTIETSENAIVTFKANSTYPNMASIVNIKTDLNQDGFADLFIAHPREVDLAGSVYLFYGNRSQWKSVINCREADASFFGEEQGKNLGCVMVNAYALLTPGLQGILLGSLGHLEGGTNNGKAYYLKGISNKEPIPIESLIVYSDSDFSKKALHLDHGDKAFIELIGEDINSTTRNSASVNVSYGPGIPPIRVICIETGISSGIYRGIHHVKNTASYGDILNFSAVGDPFVYHTLFVETAVRISETPTKVFIDQNEELEIKFSNLGWETDPIWTFFTRSTWISFDPVSKTVSGIPDNGDVGNHVFSISISDKRGNSSGIEVEVQVENVPPVILNEDVTSVLQDRPYRVDYISSQDGQPGITWNFSTEATWLFIDTKNAVLEGTPNNEHVGQYYMNVRVEDGNGGRDSRSFIINVLNVNDRPIIITEDVLSVKQNEQYRNKYEVWDPDHNDYHIWSLKTDAKWLHMNEVTGILEGRPGPYDVGIYWVYVTVTDSGELSDSRNFTLTVINVNDPPVFVEFPQNTLLKTGEFYRSVVSVYDPDEGDTAEFSVSTIPESDLIIDYLTGEIRWIATLNCFEKKPYILFVTVIVEDAAGDTVSGTFQLEVLPSAKPRVKLISPEEKQILSAKNLTLVWSGIDEDDDELTYDIYISRTQAHVMSLKDEALIIAGIKESNITLRGLETGLEYYWTVIPNDGFSYGTCEDGIRRFYLNSPPEVFSLDLQEIRIGEELRIVIKASDKDLPQGQSLSFQLIEGPAGMTVTSKGGLLTWKPDKVQIMMHLVKVSVTDGIDTTEVTFTVNVLPESREGGWSGLLMIIGVVIAVLIFIAGIGALLYFRRKKKELDKGEMEEQVIGSHDDDEKVPVTKCDVPLSAQEAHAQLGRGSKKVSYEDLYGTPAPKKDEEALDTKQLKEFIGEQIKELEKNK